MERRYGSKEMIFINLSEKTTTYTDPSSHGREGGIRTSAK